MTQARAHKLQTSIQRLGDIEHIHTVEPGMIRAFRKYAVPEFSSSGHGMMMRDATVWEWLTVAQHHGLPTRLLDWTHNPMIAAHFVTDRPEDLGTDGAIWCVEPGELNARSEEFRRWNLSRPQGAKVLGLFTIEQLEEYCHDCGGCPRQRIFVVARRLSYACASHFPTLQPRSTRGQEAASRRSRCSTPRSCAAPSWSRRPSTPAWCTSRGCFRCCRPRRTWRRC